MPTFMWVSITPVRGHSTIGAGGEAALNFELVKNFRFVTNGMYGYGIGRYLTGLGPQYVVRPVALSATSFDVATSMVHSGGGTGGFEIQAGKNTQIGTYYGGGYFPRNTFADLTAAQTNPPISCPPGPALFDKTCTRACGTDSAQP